jgi:hypothetical protein
MEICDFKTPNIQYLPNIEPLDVNLSYVAAAPWVLRDIQGPSLFIHVHRIPR